MQVEAGRESNMNATDKGRGVGKRPEGQAMVKGSETKVRMWNLGEWERRWRMRSDQDCWEAKFGCQPELFPEESQDQTSWSVASEQ